MLSEDGSKEYIINPQELIGLDVNKAQKMILSSGAEIKDCFYRESHQKRFTLVDVKVESRDEERDKYTLFLAGKNPIAHLPSLYQENAFLEKFLWIFQHIQYNQIRTLDNLHTFFTPEEAPLDFLYWMADWFGMNNKGDLDEKTIRTLLQKGLTLFKWRGTVKGLSMYLELTMKVKPQILENTFPLTDFYILGEKSVNRVIRNHVSNGIPFFTVHFSVEIDWFNRVEKSRISTIVEQEKPAHALYYITFNNSTKTKQKGILINDNQLL